MSQFVYEDGSGNLYNEQGTSVSIIDMEVDEDQYPLANITNFGEYTDLKPPEKPIKASKIKPKDVVEKEEKQKKTYRSYKSDDKAIFFYFVYEKQLSVRAA